ncbi:MAG TPA: DMT family transporter, partial [Methanocorpusculum sp.]|nr:DMT family transporter [Methanocorpusculum sp.]
MGFRRLLFPLLVFLGGCCYGPSSSMIKIAYDAGFSSNDVLISQYFYGWLILLVMVSVGFLNGFFFHLPLFHTQWTVRRFLSLFATGATLALVSTCYCFSLQSIPASLSVILLFQFTWIGVLIQTLVEWNIPSRRTIVAVALLILGTILAADFFGSRLSLTAEGIIFGILSALFYALYMFLLGHKESGMSPLMRSFVVLSCSLAILLCILSSVSILSFQVLSDLWTYGCILGLFGCALPMFLFSIGTPRISIGSATILSSSELPASIVCSVVILSEGVSWIQWMGIALIFFGIASLYFWDEDRIDVVS